LSTTTWLAAEGSKIDGDEDTKRTGGEDKVRGPPTIGRPAGRGGGWGGGELEREEGKRDGWIVH